MGRDDEIVHGPSLPRWYCIHLRIRAGSTSRGFEKSISSIKRADIRAGRVGETPDTLGATLRRWARGGCEMAEGSLFGTRQIPRLTPLPPTPPRELGMTVAGLTAPASGTLLLAGRRRRRRRRVRGRWPHARLRRGPSRCHRVKALALRRRA